MKYEVYILPFSIVVVVYFWTSSFVVRTSKIHIVLVPRDKWIEKKVSCPDSLDIQWLEINEPCCSKNKLHVQYSARGLQKFFNYLQTYL